MNIYYSDAFVKQIQKKYDKNPSLRIKVVKQVKFFKKDINYPSLKTHKLSGNRAEQYAFWIEANLRIIFIYSGGDVIFTDIVSHDRY